MSRSAARTLFWLSALVIGAVAIRPFFWHTQLAGNFSSYQTVFGMIGERYFAGHFQNLFRPELFLIENGKPALELIFLPGVSILAAVCKTVWGGDLDAWGRSVSVAATAVNVILIYRLARHDLSEKAALFSSFFFAVSPLTWVYGRNFQNEALAVLCLSAAILWYRRAKPLIVLSALAFGLAAAMRFHLILFFPFFFFLGRPSAGRFAIWGALAVLAPIAWHANAWVIQHSTDHVHTTLFMQSGVGKTFPNPLLLNPQFYWHLAKNILLWFVGPVGFLLSIGGLVRKEARIWILFLALSLAIAFLIPQKFYDQHYYLYPAVIPFSLLAGLGMDSVLQKRFLVIGAMALAVASSALFSWNPSFKRSESEIALRSVSNFIREKTSPNDWIIAAHGSSGDLLYYSGRLGWGFSINPHDKRELNVYMKIRGLNFLDPAEWERRNRAFGNSIAWLEYLREKGAQYFFSSSRGELERNRELLFYLESRYRKITSDRDPFYGFKL